LSGGADLEIVDELAERPTDEPRLGDVADDGGRQAHEHDKQVGRRRVATATAATARIAAAA